MQQSSHWTAEYSLSVQEDICEAMNTPFAPNVESPRDLLPSTPEPHLPLRKASVQRLQASRRAAPRPLLDPSSSQDQHQQQYQQRHHHQLRGFSPTRVEPLPHIDATTASSEHAFAGHEYRSKKPFRPPLGVQALHQGSENGTPYAQRPVSSNTEEEDNRPPSSPLLPPPPKSPFGKGSKLRSTKSLADGLRGLRHRVTSGNKGHPQDGRETPDSVNGSTVGNDGVRASLRSALTSHSSYMNTSSVNTDRSSVLTANSSHSNFVQVYPNWPEMEPPPKKSFGHESKASMASFSVEDAIGMYEDGFESRKGSMDVQSFRSFRKGSFEVQSLRSLQEEKPSSSQHFLQTKRPNYAHRRSQSASLLERIKPSMEGGLMPPQLDPKFTRSSTEIMSGKHSTDTQRPKDVVVPVTVPAAVPRDRYGFKKVSHHITVEQYDAWDRTYAEHLDRRRKKWENLMRSYGLSTDRPIRFPPKSDKIKRYVRKGIPPEWRGAAWFWYAGGPGLLAKQPGLYWSLVEQVEQGKLSDNDREHIERDLNRTFPDNVRFKPDPTTTLDAQAGAGGGKKRKSVEPEQPIVRSLRRVLQAFAVHNPSIGYCQSLNFIAGLLLVFLDEDEEKAFTLLNIVTSLHLPGTHGVALEGANIDIAVLMTCIKDCLPAIWTKLDDKGGGPALDPNSQTLRLPTISLATTAWFMSLFVGTLPIESVLRVWDCLFFEGSKTLFRIALAIFKAGEKQILFVSDPMEIFQVVQTIPRSMLDINALMEVCFKRRGGFGHVSQGLIEGRREERRRDVKKDIEDGNGGLKKFKRWRSKTTKT